MVGGTSRCLEFACKSSPEKWVVMGGAQPTDPRPRMDPRLTRVRLTNTIHVSTNFNSLIRKIPCKIRTLKDSPYRYF